jgi:aspartate 1-decarboxylase
MEDAEARAYQPRVVFVDADNRVMGLGHDPAEALPGTGLLRGDLTYPVRNPAHSGSYDDDPVLAW